MADQSSTPGSLKKLEIDAQRLLETEAESTLKSLTLLGDECPRVTCKCNTGTRSQPSWAWNTRHFTVLKSPSNSPTSGKNGVLKKSSFKSSNQRGKARILREPILKLTNSPLKEALSSVSCSVSPVRADPKKCEQSSENKSACASEESSKIFGQGSSASHGDFSSLLPNDSASLSSTKVTKDFDAASYRHLRCSATATLSSSKVTKRKKELRSEGQIKTCPVPLADINNALMSRPSTSQSTTCSQQARMVGAGHCDDVTIDELASYFDLFVHIPRKMSHMAENMYI